VGTIRMALHSRSARPPDPADTGLTSLPQLPRGADSGARESLRQFVMAPDPLFLPRPVISFPLFLPDTRLSHRASAAERPSISCRAGCVDCALWSDSYAGRVNWMRWMAMNVNPLVRDWLRPVYAPRLTRP